MVERAQTNAAKRAPARKTSGGSKAAGSARVLGASAGKKSTKGKGDKAQAKAPDAASAKPSDAQRKPKEAAEAKATKRSKGAGEPSAAKRKKATGSRGKLAGRRDELLGYFRKMYEIRRFEEESARGYAQGKIGGFLHLYIGQEAVGVGISAALEQEDYLFQSYRDHGVALARGMSANAAMAELYGKDTGCSRGLGGSMHFFDVANNFLGGYGIVGGQIPLAAGTAFKSKYTQDGRVTVCLFGDGATNIAGFHEALSLAGLWKLPVIFVCENNEYSMGTPMHRTSPVKDIADKGPGYGMEGVICEGHDVLQVKACMAEVVERARTGGGPTLVEMKTYRFRGHSISDPAKYRTDEEVKTRKAQDPLVVCRKHLAAAGVSDEELAAIEEEIEAVVQAAVAFAEDSEPAKVEVMENAVYAPLEA